jgi:hypothetical protein
MPETHHDNVYHEIIELVDVVQLINEFIFRIGMHVSIFGN